MRVCGQKPESLSGRTCKITCITYVSTWVRAVHQREKDELERVVFFEILSLACCKFHM